jgi:hypothetical protein
MDDPIIEEIRRIRDEYARKFNYDLEAMGADLIKQQEASGRKLVSFPPRKPVMVQVRQRTETTVAEEKSEYNAKKK